MNRAQISSGLPVSVQPLHAIATSVEAGSSTWVFRLIVTGRFGIVTERFGIVTGDFGGS